MRDKRYKFNEIGYIYNRPRTEVFVNINKQSQSPGRSISSAIKQQVLGRHKPASVSVPVVWKSWPWTGIVTMPSPSMLEEFAKLMTPPGTEGWHCIPVCGWDDSTGRFLFKNSWGKSWGDHGYGTIPYEYLELYSDVGMMGW